MFLRLGAATAIFSLLTLYSACADDATPPDAAPAPQTAPMAGLDEPISQIADTPAGCAVLDKDFPGLRQHAMYDFFKSMTLKQIAALSKGQITQEMLMQAKTDLLALKTPDTSVDSAAVAAPIAVATTSDATAAAGP